LLTYLDGSKIEVGDSVLIENGRTPGVVMQLAESRAEMSECGVTLPGVMLKSAPFGLVYLPVETWKDDPLEFVSRGAPS
jgi:hypothetical protein